VQAEAALVGVITNKHTNLKNEKENQTYQYLNCKIWQNSIHVPQANEPVSIFYFTGLK